MFWLIFAVLALYAVAAIIYLILGAGILAFSGTASLMKRNKIFRGTVLFLVASLIALALYDYWDFKDARFWYCDNVAFFIAYPDGEGLEYPETWNNMDYAIAMDECLQSYHRRVYGFDHEGPYHVDYFPFVWRSNFPNYHLFH